jgi:hypothetical protein
VEEYRLGFEAAQAALAHAEADVDVSKARLDVAKEDRDHVQTLLQYTKIRAPFGVYPVGSRSVNPEWGGREDTPACSMSPARSREMRRNPKQHGMGRAVFGIVMGSIGTIALVLVIVALIASGLGLRW